MKKHKSILSILTLSISLSILCLIPSNVAACSTYPSHKTYNTIILHVQSSNYDYHTNLYIAEVMDENGDIYIIQSYDNISDQWLDATITLDGEIIDYTIMDYLH